MWIETNWGKWIKFHLRPFFNIKQWTQKNIKKETFTLFNYQHFRFFFSFSSLNSVVWKIFHSYYFGYFLGRFQHVLWAYVHSPFWQEFYISWLIFWEDISPWRIGISCLLVRRKTNLKEKSFLIFCLGNKREKLRRKNISFSQCFR